MSQIKVSVVVPFYNVQEYIEKSLESLVNQTLQEIEIIVVNDGSKDDSESIARKFADAYPDKVKLLTKENGGLSDARNYGMQFATGEYVGFLDSDDYVDADMYQGMYDKAKEGNFQIVECNLHHTYPDYEDTEIGEHITDKKKLIMDGRSVVWNKIYDRAWLEGTGVTFHKGIIYEDVEFFVKLVPYMERYAYVEPAFVHYVQRASSINNMSSKKTLDILRVLDEIKNYFVDRNLFEEYKDALEYLYARIILCSSFSRMCRIPDKAGRNAAMKENYETLAKTFPNWRKNAYIKANNSRNGMFMKSVTKTTYGVYKTILPALFKLKHGKKAN